jgi:O-antigen biosynthesis protein
MQLSVVIVNYNVKYFLEQCLNSVYKSGKHLDMEIYVVDNHSVDGSVEMVRAKFPNVRLIANQQNIGFSRANNQAIRKAKGRYVLLLNPDTVVEDDTLTKVVSFMDAHPDAGGLGVKMLDGQGRFLPESKRGLPTPGVAFSKIFGLSALFPRSKTFGKYHLGYLDKDKTHKVHVLSGAFMLLRKDVLEEIGALDEEFFMYGEDIDLSHRIIKAGYKNYYYPDARIIHYKGESTKKSSVNYVLVFYNAMIIFARKHFSQKNARAFSLLIKMAIYFRALLALTARFLKRIFWPALDAGLIYGGFYYLTNYWGHQVFASETPYYPPAFMQFIVPAYILFWLISVFISGGYDRPVRLFRIVRGIIWGTIAILVIYALLPIHLRFSRALILLGSIWAVFSMLLTRSTFTLIKEKTLHVSSPENKRVLIAGDGEEAARILRMMRLSGNTAFIGMVSLKTIKPQQEGYLGVISQINEIIDIYKINEVIFCAGNMSSQDIINHMSILQDKQVHFKIAPPEGLYIIGSNSIDTFGDLFTVNVNAINLPANKRQKRLFDLAFSFLLLITLPVHFIFQKHRWGFLRNLFLVIANKLSWVGYHPVTGVQKLPRLKKSVLHPGDTLRHKRLPEETMENLNNLYAKDYKLEVDIQICIKAYRLWGKKSTE